MLKDESAASLIVVRKWEAKIREACAGERRQQMSKGLEAKTGPYMHARDACWTKEFDGGRKFTVLIAGAYNAGIIGPEHNGIAVLDENNHAVVLDQHVCEASGYQGPSSAQRAEAQRILAMDWDDFAKFCRENPRYRGSMSDAFDSEPDVFEGVENSVIFPNGDKEEKERELFPLEGRADIQNYLMEHETHKVGGPYSKSALAWSIKVGNFDTSGKQGDEEVDERFDERWEAEVENNPHIFSTACEDALRTFTEGEYSTYPGNDQGHYTFGIAGRSGGWLTLESVKGISEKLAWEDLAEYENFLNSLLDEEMVSLYRVVANLDHDVTGPKINKEMAYQYSFQRANMEEIWKADLEDEMEADEQAKPSV